MSMFTEDDQRDIRARGLTPEEAGRQLDLLRNPPAPARLERACTIGDGIRRLSEGEIRSALADYEAARSTGRLLKMVPASGAASRMFQALLRAKNEWSELRRDDIAARAETDPDAGTVLAFMDGLHRLAFFEPLCTRMARDGLDTRELLGGGDLSTILGYLLTQRGLDYACLPKGLLAFHRASDGVRTALEEHLVEAADFVRDSNGLCRLHFTISAEHRDRFVVHLEEIRGIWESRLEVRYEVGFSFQHSATDTIALNEDNQVFRTGDGRILFRPGGHGALIGNLDDLHADLVHLCNIDNVVPDRLRPGITHWRRVLAGYLCGLQRRAHAHARPLAQSRVDHESIDAALGFVRRDLDLDVPHPVVTGDDTTRRQFLLAHLDRPMRVCGMVLNTGEPGGGPFWVRGRGGELTRQIVESAQVDPVSAHQQHIFQSSTHFNPVDLVCGVRDHRGDCFNLRKRVDPDAVFIANKSHEGRLLKALEHPGLWNGAMSDWTTIFVEIPVHVFNPVKTALDLLRPEHQPG